MSPLTNLSIPEFLDSMKQEGTRRVYLVWDPEAKRVRVSHPFLAELGAALEQDPVDFEHHEGIFLEVGERSGALLGAFVHHTVRGQAAGGVRFWQYDNLGGFLNDGIRLAKGMTHKIALAGLWWGGGKGVIARPEGADWRDPDLRKRVYNDFGDLMTSLKGCYVTAEDIGTNTDDMGEVFARTRFTTCIPESVGGSGNPSAPTARGVVSGIAAALEHLDMGSIEGKRIAIQGLGNVGRPLAGFLLDRGAARILGSDVDARRKEEIEVAFPGAAIDVTIGSVDDASILAADADVVCPCATGGTLNDKTIPTIKAAIVCGAANNQLQVPGRDGPLMVQHGVAYVPDFLANRMGIVNCADEQSGYIPTDPHFERHLGRDWQYSIHLLTKQILANAKRTGDATDVEARRLAEEFMREPHPIWGHRGPAIIEGLVNEGWEKS